MKILEIRLKWIRQLIDWTATGRVGSTVYSQEEMHNLISTDKRAAGLIPDYIRILELFSTPASKSEIKAQLHEILKKVIV